MDCVVKDIETIRQMLTRARITYWEGNADANDRLQMSQAWWVIQVGAGDPDHEVGPNNVGYNGFVSRFYFGPEGNLVAMGAWE